MCVNVALSVVNVTCGAYALLELGGGGVHAPHGLVRHRARQTRLRGQVRVVHAQRLAVGRGGRRGRRREGVGGICVELRDPVPIPDERQQRVPGAHGRYTVVPAHGLVRLLRAQPRQSPSPPAHGVSQSRSCAVAQSCTPQARRKHAQGAASVAADRSGSGAKKAWKPEPKENATRDTPSSTTKQV